MSPDLLRRQLTIHASWTFSTRGPGGMRAVHRGPRVPLEPLLTHRFRLPRPSRPTGSSTPRPPARASSSFDSTDDRAASSRSTSRPAGCPSACPHRPRHPAGLEGDRHRNRKLHGGPDRALCLFSLERIEALQAEGHPIEPGTLGENLTLADWTGRGPPGRRLPGWGRRRSSRSPASPPRATSGTPSWTASTAANLRTRHPGGAASTRAFWSPADRARRSDRPADPAEAAPARSRLRAGGAGR